MGKTPHGIHTASRPVLQVMKTKQRKKAITLGEFIASVYDAHGKRIGRGFVRLAIKAHLVGLYPMVKEWDNAIT
jgi:hypothetical protein